MIETHLVVHTDGAYRDYKGIQEMGVGVTIHDQDHKVVYELAQHLDKTGSVNYSEYYAVMKALKWLIKEDFNSAIIRTDSRLVANQLNGEWAINSGVYVELGKGVKRLFDLYPRITIKWTRRNNNIRADELSKIGLNGTNYEKNLNLDNEN